MSLSSKAVMAMFSARGLARWLGCKPSTVREAIRRGRLNAERVGKTWVICEDERLKEFVSHLVQLEAARRKRANAMRLLWRLDPLRFKKPPKKKFKLTVKITNLILKPLPSNLSTGDESVVICPTCFSWLQYTVNAMLVRECEEIKDA